MAVNWDAVIQRLRQKAWEGIRRGTVTKETLFLLMGKTSERMTEMEIELLVELCKAEPSVLTGKEIWQQISLAWITLTNHH